MTTDERPGAPGRLGISVTGRRARPLGGPRGTCGESSRSGPHLPPRRDRRHTLPAR